MVAKPFPITVYYDPDAASELANDVKSKEERKAIYNAVDKLRRLGEELAPPHVKTLRGEDTKALRELRPRQGRSDWRALYRRFDAAYVILAVAKHADLGKATTQAQARADQYR